MPRRHLVMFADILVITVHSVGVEARDAAE